jgi:hydroxyacylglutathione hydrolase
MKRINQSGPRLLDEVRADWLSPDALAAALGERNTIVDTRDAANYGQGSIPGTINIPANRAFTTWAGSLLPYDRDLQLILDDNKPGLAEELTRDLAGIGLDRVTGYFGLDVIQGWSRSHGELQRISALTLPQVSTMLSSHNPILLDVREQSEWRAGHIPGSRNVPVGQLNERLGDIPRNGTVVVHCQTGARAAIAASVLRTRGFDDIRLFTGGFAEWRAAGKPVERE